MAAKLMDSGTGKYSKFDRASIAPFECNAPFICRGSGQCSNRGSAPSTSHIFRPVSCQLPSDPSSQQRMFAQAICTWGYFDIAEIIVSRNCGSHQLRSEERRVGKGVHSRESRAQ